MEGSLLIASASRRRFSVWDPGSLRNIGGASDLDAASLTPETPKSSKWLAWVTEMAGLDLNDTKFVPPVKQDSKTAAAAEA